jgi:hypothetical protein
MQAQRARDAVNSNERERAPSLSSIRTDKYSFHKPNVRVECVRGSCTRIQVYSGPNDGNKVGIPDKPLEVENQGRVVPGIGVDSLDWTREEEVKSWTGNVGDRYWEIAQSRRTARRGVFVGPEFCWIARIEQYGSARCCGATCKETTSGHRLRKAGLFGFHTCPPDL